MTEAVDPTESPVQALLDVTRAEPVGEDRFSAVAPDWFGERVFGGIVVAQGVSAVGQTVDDGLLPHSFHAYFLGALRPGPVELAVERVRDGRTFTTRHSTSRQDERTALWLTASFHADEPGPAYQPPMPDVPGPASLPSVEGPPPFEIRWLGPSEPRTDGTYESTRRCWVRTNEALPDDPLTHLVVASFLSDMTGTSFRPLNLGEWQTHTDASIDHAVWFHRSFRPDDWLFCDFHAVINAGGRSTVRGQFHDEDGRLCFSMAQELLIRPTGQPPVDAPGG